jgi:hypothetical protein
MAIRRLKQKKSRLKRKRRLLPGMGIVKYIMHGHFSLKEKETLLFQLLAHGSLPPLRIYKKQAPYNT